MLANRTAPPRGGQVQIHHTTKRIQRPGKGVVWVGEHWQLSPNAVCFGWGSARGERAENGEQRRGAITRLRRRRRRRGNQRIIACLFLLVLCPFVHLNHMHREPAGVLCDSITMATHHNMKFDRRRGILPAEGGFGCLFVYLTGWTAAAVALA